MKPFDSQYYPYPSQRRVVFAKNGMVATSQYLAAQAGLEILRAGGNAIDAAIATAACLTVVEPTSNGIGGDAFALIWNKNKLYGLNASGPAPKAISAELLKKEGYEKIPNFGVIPVTVPGIPAAWAELSRKFGTLSLPQVLAPAITYADKGFPVSSLISQLWQKAYQLYLNHIKDEALHTWFDTFAPEGKTPEPGELWRLPVQAKTLQKIADSDARTFYEGEIAEKIDTFFKKHNGYLSKEDLASFVPQWVNPISICYRGYDVWEIPPNGQGLVALMALNILKEFQITKIEEYDTFHHQIEAIKLAFVDGKHCITDFFDMQIEIEELLSSEYAHHRKKMLTDKAFDPGLVTPFGNDTVYLATADNQGNMVSYIQSNYMGFGSGIVIPGTGIALQNRGANFSLEPSHTNCLKPGKKTYHTIIPGFLSKDGKAIGPFGVMGGFMQPQGQVQVLTNMIDFHLNPQSALDAPRWQWVKGKKVKVEKNFPQNITKDLENKGHVIEIAADSNEFGRGQIIWKDKNGTLIGATDPRADGAVAAW